MNATVQIQQDQQYQTTQDGILTGEILAFRYMYPCAEGMADRKKISLNHFNELRKLVESGGQPRRALLKYCFPNAFKTMRSTALYLHHISQLAKTAENDGRYGNGKFDPNSTWNISNIRIHWRCIHNFRHSGSCATTELVVTDINQNDLIVFAASRKKDHSITKVINLFRLKLWIGTVIYTHRGVIAEVEEDH